jgi:uncharacterized phage protein (TIGR01671 family)
MRDIKFKGIDYYEKTYNNKIVFVYGSLIIGNNNNYILTDEDKESMVCSISNHMCTYVKRIIKDSESQYTELKDKNGKEIYEGDIVKIDNSLFSFIDYIIYNDYGSLMFFKHDLRLEGYIRVSEIIGNIYENPELLEDK